MKTLQICSIAVLCVILAYDPSLYAQTVVTTKPSGSESASSVSKSGIPDFLKDEYDYDYHPELADVENHDDESNSDIGESVHANANESEDYNNGRAREFHHQTASEAGVPVDTAEVASGVQSTLPMLTKSDEENHEIIANLKGIVLIGNPDELNKKEYQGLTGVNIVDLSVPGKASNLQERLSKYIGQAFRMNDLNRIKRTIILYYKSEGRPVVAVQIPEQDVTDGILQILVTEATLGKIRTIGNKHFRSSLLKRYIKIKPGEPIDEETLVENLNFMNRNPFRRTDAVFTPGEVSGTTDIELVTQDRRQARVYIGVDNTGIRRTGANRWFTGFNWGNAWGLDHQLSYQYTTSSNFHHFQAHTVNYTMPLPWVQHMLTFFGGYSNVHAHLPAPGMRSHGNSYQASMRYDIPLPPIKSYLHDIIAGYDFKRTNNTVEFGGYPTFGGNANLTQFVTIYNGGIQTRYTKTFIEAELYYSPFEWVGDQSHEDYSSLRPGADPVYVYGRVSLVNTYYMPRDFSFNFVFRSQLASAALLPSEQFGIGGYNTVRGYDERAVNVDNGYILSAEVRTPVLGILKYIRNHNFKDGLQLLAFVDYGYGRDHRDVPTYPKNQYLISVGPGLRYNWDPYLAIRLDLGVKLHRHDFDGGPTRLHFSVIASY